jgi:aminopeptidase
MNLKRGEAIVIRGGVHAQPLLEEIGLLCYKQGAQPLIMTTSDNFSARVYREIAKETLELTPKHYLGAIKAADGYIVVDPFKDPKISTTFPQEKIAAKTQANVPIRKELYGEETGRGKKWIYAAWPTQEAARFYGIDYADLERFIIDGIMVPPAVLKENTSKLANWLKNRDVLRVTDANGTDFICKITGRRIYQEDGVLEDADIILKDLGNNLPAGEVFVAPHETFGDGTIRCPITVDPFTNKIIRDVTLRFRQGQLLLDDCTAETNHDQMIDTFERCLKIDKNEKEVRTTHIAELGIGCNPAIDEAIGYILTDEKLSGSVHVAFGLNLLFGGTSMSCLHWDFVTHPSATIEIVDTNEVIMQQGKLL